KAASSSTASTAAASSKCAGCAPACRKRSSCRRWNAAGCPNHPTVPTKNVDTGTTLARNQRNLTDLMYTTTNTVQRFAQMNIQTDELAALRNIITTANALEETLYQLELQQANAADSGHRPLERVSSSLSVQVDTPNKPPTE